MFACIMDLYEYMNSLRNDFNNLLDNVHVPIKIYQEFYHSIIYIVMLETMDISHMVIQLGHMHFLKVVGSKNIYAVLKNFSVT